MVVVLVFGTTGFGWETWLLALDAWDIGASDWRSAADFI